MDITKGTSAQDCQAQCQRNAKCMYFSCAEPVEYCLLKSALYPLVPGNGWTSGPRHC